MTIEMKTQGEKIKNWPQILAIIAAALSSLSSGCLFNWTSPSIPILISEKYYGIDIELSSYLVVIPPIATILTSPFYAIFVEKYGRKYCLLSIGILHLISWILIMTAKSIYVFYASRILYGTADAAMFIALPVYIAEVATPKIRGTWGNAMSVFAYSGQFAINVVGFYFEIATTAYVFASIAVIFFVIFAFMPETPTYFLMKGKPEKAKESLEKLRETKNVDSEFHQLDLDVKRQMSEAGSFKDVFLIKSNRNAILILALVRTMQQMSGSASFAAYTQYIFLEAGGDIDIGHASMIYSGVLLLSNAIGSLFMDKLGRKMATVISCIGCFVALSSEAIYFYLKQNNVVDVTSFSWFPVAGMIFYVLNFSMGLSLVPTLFLSELISSSVRGKVGCITIIIFSLYVSGITKLFQYLVVNFGLFMPFALFAVSTFASIFLSYFFVPETKGRTLEEIQQMLKGNKPA